MHASQEECIPRASLHCPPRLFSDERKLVPLDRMGLKWWCRALRTEHARLWAAPLVSCICRASAGDMGQIVISAAYHE